ncbi:MAG: divalent-cation tolerance protein CutA [Chitinispirillia bacterium]|nr:divalent-cation tolerance protein CutA [Chitinispirillia bacterium]MCL2267974.1 divalent-cation tolerance protein CutA [Chitinispirillia bacterium]
MDFVFAYITTKDKAQALEIGKALIDERLAGCVNIIDNMTSIYRWEGKVQSHSEVILIAKTSADKFGPLSNKVKQIHSDNCPCIVSVPVTGGNWAYLNWLSSEIGG